MEGDEDCPKLAQVKKHIYSSIESYGVIVDGVKIKKLMLLSYGDLFGKNYHKLMPLVL